MDRETLAMKEADNYIGRSGILDRAETDREPSEIDRELKMLGAAIDDSGLVTHNLAERIQPILSPESDGMELSSETDRSVESQIAQHIQSLRYKVELVNTRLRETQRRVRL